MIVPLNGIERQFADPLFRLSNGRLREEYYAPIAPDRFAAKPGDQTLEIGIIGAGIAGLTAASALVQSGHRVEVRFVTEYFRDDSLNVIADLRDRSCDNRSSKCVSRTQLSRLQFRTSKAYTSGSCQYQRRFTTQFQMHVANTCPVPVHQRQESGGHTYRRCAGLHEHIRLSMGPVP